MKNREIYPHAPIALTAFEMRHSICPKMSLAAERKVKDILGSGLPVRGQAQAINPGLGQVIQSGIKTEVAPRFTSRDRTSAVTFFSASVVIETTGYRRWEDFRENIERALNARQAIDPTEGVERVGLRYIDEIRVPSDAESGFTDWKKWIDASLLGPVNATEKVGLSPLQSQGVSTFSSGADKTLVLRYGPREGFAIDPAGELKRNTSLSGSYFLFDIDNFWIPSGDVPKAVVGELLQVADELHAPVRELFEGLITDQLRNEVLRNV